MNTRHHLLAAHSIIPFLLFTLVGAFALTGWLPPPSPSLSNGDTAALFRDDLIMRIGVSIIVVGSPLYMGLSCAMFFQLRRIEGVAPVLSTLQMISSAVTVLTVMGPGYLWLAISYNADTPAEVIVMVNNLAFFILIADVWPVILQQVCIALCILGSRVSGTGTSVYPRWLGYANIAVIVTLIPGEFIPFFHTGPLTYTGIIGFWVVVIGFFTWAMLMWWHTVKAIKSQASTEKSEPTAIAV
ncbi:MAG TPA: hypothetical protein VFA63_13980 [Pseudonocardiaceae bacterium]|nr:hypothetical protein [Pseudonocardiaceae bacterium]